MTYPSTTASRPSTAQVPTRTFRVTYAESGDSVEREGRLKLDEGWLIITDSDQDGAYVVFAAPSESVLSVETI